jgi:Ca2+-binding EF-hand superfamily protein
MNKKTMILSLALGLVTLQPALAQDSGTGDRREMFRQKMQERLQQMDTDGDGSLSKSEFMAQAEERFNKMDANGDGLITSDERAALRERLKQGAGGGLGGEQFP